MLIGVQGDFGGSPTGGMTVRHFDGDAEIFGAFWKGIRFHVAIERVCKVVSAVHEEHRHVGCGQVLRGIPEGNPALTLLGRHFLEASDPGAVFLKEAASVYWDCDFEAGVDTCDNRGEVASPTDARDTGLLCVHFGETPDERMSFHCGCDRVIRPLLGWSEIDAAELFFVALIGAAFREPRAIFFVVCVLSFDRLVASGVHRDGGVPLFGP